MKAAREERLKKAGWKIGTAQEFLGLTDEETALIEMKLALARSAKQLRQFRRLTQADLAKRIGSSQSRIAKMESADASVSLDLMVRTLLALGASRQEVGRMLG